MDVTGRLLDQACCYIILCVSVCMRVCACMSLPAGLVDDVDKAMSSLGGSEAVSEVSCCGELNLL